MPMTHDKFPRQTKNVGKKVLVCFNGDLAHIVSGVIVRDDETAYADSTTVTIILIKGDNTLNIPPAPFERYVMAYECQFQIID
jgi:hypothetical protein